MYKKKKKKLKPATTQKTSAETQRVRRTVPSMTGFRGDVKGYFSAIARKNRPVAMSSARKREIRRYDSIVINYSEMYVTPSLPPWANALP